MICEQSVERRRVRIGIVYSSFRLSRTVLLDVMFVCRGILLTSQANSEVGANLDEAQKDFADH